MKTSTDCARSSPARATGPDEIESFALSMRQSQGEGTAPHQDKAGQTSLF